MTKYKKIALELKERILQGVYSNEKPIPKQVQLAKEFNVSRITIQKSLNILTTEGLIYSKQGSGTYIMKNLSINRLKDVKVNEYMGTTALMKGYKVESKIIKFSIDFPTEEVQEKLFIPSNQPVYYIVRLRLIDGSPFSLESSCMPLNIIQGLTNEVLKESIYDFIQNELCLEIGGAYRKIKADKPTEEDKQHLKCKETDPVLDIAQVVYLKDGTPFECSDSRRRYDKGVFIYTDI